MLHAFRIVYKNNRGMVPGLTNKNGHRNIAEGRNTAGWGGFCIKPLLIADVGRWLHTDVE